MAISRMILTMPAELAAQLAAVCAITGDREHDIILDALALHLDEIEAGAEALPEPAA